MTRGPTGLCGLKTFTILPRFSRLHDSTTMARSLGRHIGIAQSPQPLFIAQFDTTAPAVAHSDSSLALVDAATAFDQFC